MDLSCFNGEMISREMNRLTDNDLDEIINESQIDNQEKSQEKETEDFQYDYVFDTLDYILNCDYNDIVKGGLLIRIVNGYLKDSFNRDVSNRSCIEDINYSFDNVRNKIIDNIDLVHVINDYINDDLYQYAFMLNGSWGCGKTHFVKNILTLPSGCSLVYISLYGIRSVQELKEAHMDAMLRACIAGLELPSSKGVKEVIQLFGTSFFSRFAREKFCFFSEDDQNAFRDFLGKSIQKGLDKVSEQVGKSNRFLYVFDDLERCCIPVIEILGYLNSLVESFGYKVLIVARVCF